jgi:UDP-glucuronate decarboxylase
MKKILVTGGSGFIGVNLINKLLKKNNHIICVDNFFTSSPKNIEQFKDKNNFEFLRHDITFPLYIEVDEIYNLACPASPIHYQRDPVQTTKVNVVGSINLLGLAKRTNSKIFLASTSEVYGDPSVSPQKESYWGNVNPIGIRSCYDEGKRCAETLFMDYFRQHKLNIKIARIFNTYGPYMAENDGRVVSNFIVNCLKNKPIEIYGDGSQTRSFCYVDDLTNGILKLMRSNKKITGPINLGNNAEISIKDLAQIIKKMTMSKSKITFKKLPDDDPKKRKPDLSLANKELSWKPSINLKNGLIDTINYFEKKLFKN